MFDAVLVDLDKEDLAVNIRLLDAVEKADSRLEKERLLREDADEQTKRAIKYATDTFITFGLTLDPGTLGMASDTDLAAADARLFGPTGWTPSQRARDIDPTTWWNQGFDLLDCLADREYTGHAAHARVVGWLRDAPATQHVKWALRVINKDLRCGVSQKTVVKLWSGLIEPFSVALAHPYDADKHRLGDGYIEPKLDGLRIVVIDGIAYTRNGHVVPGLDHVIQSIGGLAHYWVFDGECLNPSVTFEETSGTLRRHTGDKTGQVFHVFDMIDRGAWRDRDTSTTAQRKADLLAVARDEGWNTVGSPIRAIHGTRVRSPTVSDMLEARDRYIAAGLEGAMFKAAHEPYQFKRSDAALKFKRFETMDVKIVDTVEGTGKHVGRLGAIVVEIDDTRFNVGSGFTDTERSELWVKRALLPGRCVEVKYQNKTAKGKGRFPTYVRMRPDKDK